MVGTHLLLLWLNLQSHLPAAVLVPGRKFKLAVPRSLLAGRGRCPPGYGDNKVNQVSIGDVWNN
jgi:hypothetical protein